MVVAALEYACSFCDVLNEAGSGLASNVYRPLVGVMLLQSGLLAVLLECPTHHFACAGNYTFAPHHINSKPTVPFRDLPQVGMGSPAPLWRGGNGGGGGFGRDHKDKNGGSTSGSVNTGSGGVGGVSSRRHSSAGEGNNGRFPPPPPPGAATAQAGVVPRSYAIMRLVVH